MRKHRLPQKVCLFIILAVILGWGVNTCFHKLADNGDSTDQKAVITDVTKGIFDREPSEVQNLREQSVADTDEEGYQEYYFHLLEESEKRIYREMLNGIRKRENGFYLTTSDETKINKVYHALLRIIRNCSGFITVRRYIQLPIREVITVSFLRVIHTQKKK